MSYRASTNKPYTVGCSRDKKYYVQGPAPFGEFSYYGGTLNADLRIDRPYEEKGK